MRCPVCRHVDSRVLDSRPTEEGAVIRRRRECMNTGCRERWTTYETVEAIPLWVVKKDGRRELFEGTKVLTGLLTACEKRPVPLAVLQQVAADVERDLRGRFEREVESSLIGELVLARLRHLDEVAYVRFASVYRQVQNLETFRQELDRLLDHS